MAIPLVRDAGRFAMAIIVLDADAGEEFLRRRRGGPRRLDRRQLPSWSKSPTMRAITSRSTVPTSATRSAAAVPSSDSNSSTPQARPRGHRRPSRSWSPRRMPCGAGSARRTPPRPPRSWAPRRRGRSALEAIVTAEGASGRQRRALRGHPTAGARAPQFPATVRRPRAIVARAMRAAQDAGCRLL
jgi:hypothetical protein